MSTKRVLVHLFHDTAGRVDDYVPRAVQSLRPFVDHVLVVANGSLGDAGRRALEAVADEVLQRENTGMDVGGYRAALEHLGWRTVADLDELLLVNNTFLAPVRPWEPVFKAAAAHPQASFWGLTEHGELRPHPFLARRLMPRHIQSHFLAVRHRLLADPAFRQYWRTMPAISTYNDSVAHHESRFTEHFHALGHTSFVAFPLEDFKGPNPVLEEPAALLAAGCPVLKRRVLFHDPLHLDSRGVDGPGVIAAATSHGYPAPELIGSVVRVAEPRVLIANAGLTALVDESAPGGAASPGAAGTDGAPHSSLRVHALARSRSELAHLLSILTDLAPTGPAVLACASRQLEDLARRRTADQDLDLDVRPASAAGAGAMASLLLDAPDLLEDDAPVLRLPTSTDLAADPVAASADALRSCLAMLDTYPGLGVVVPAAPVVGSAYLGHGWAGLRDLATEVAGQAGITTPLDADSPVWSYGASTLVRASALGPLRRLDLRALAAQAAPGPEALGAVLERLVVASAASQGLHCRQVLGRRAADQYGLLEYRYQSLAALLPGDAETQLHHLQARSGQDAGIAARLRRDLESRSPRLAATLTPAYRGAVAAVARLTRRVRPHR